MAFLIRGCSQRAKGKYEKWLLPENLILLEGWARDGLTDEQLSEKMQISPSTLYEWKKKHTEISEALKKGKEYSDRLVENSLFQKAVGFEKKIRKAVKIKEVLYQEGKRISEKEHIEFVDETVYFPPDVTAQIFWLKNRKPEMWREKPNPESLAEYESDGFTEAMKGEISSLEGDVIETESAV